jgi:hypothetical protein
VVVVPVVVGVVVAGPLETLIPTTDPFGTRVLGRGSWEITMPRGLRDSTLETLTSKPRVSSLAVAVASVRPVTRGTGT